MLNQIRDGNAAALLYMLPILVITLTVHELCHGLAAYALGDTTAKEQGRLSLNPLKHIDLIGFIALLTFGFGWAKPVGVDLRNLSKPKRDFALVAVAGPFSNFLLAFIFALVIAILDYSSLLGEKSWEILSYAVSINLGLGVFNMLPIPPLDGSRLLAAFLPDKLYTRYLQFGRYGMMLVLALVAFGGLSDVLSNIILNLFRAMYTTAEAPVKLIYNLLH